MIITSTIRLGTSADAVAIQKLLRTSGDGNGRDLTAITTVSGRRYLLVLDAPDGELAAAAQVTLDNERGHLGLLAIAERFHGIGLEHRLLAVAEALCDAFGCEGLDVPVHARAA
jgi:GNAT superfamily N-acetyltransferase